MKKAIFISIFTLSVVLVAILLVQKSLSSAYKETCSPRTSFDSEWLAVGDSIFTVSIANTPERRERGLSGTDSIPFGGMLFVFPSETVPQFWMKDMRYSLDLVWINDNGRVQSVSRSISPQTYPQTFSPDAPVRSVLELPADGALKLGITSGTMIKNAKKISQCAF